MQPLSPKTAAALATLNRDALKAESSIWTIRAKAIRILRTAAPAARQAEIARELVASVPAACARSSGGVVDRSTVAAWVKAYDNGSHTGAEIQKTINAAYQERRERAASKEPAPPDAAKLADSIAARFGLNGERKAEFVKRSARLLATVARIASGLAAAK